MRSTTHPLPIADLEDLLDHDSLGGTGGSYKLLSGDETDVTGTTSAGSVKTYSLAANTYSRIVVEAECGLVGEFNRNNRVTFRIQIDGADQEVVTLGQSATGFEEFSELGTQIKWSGLQAAAATLSIAVAVLIGLGTWHVKSFRVQGVLA